MAAKPLCAVCLRPVDHFEERVEEFIGRRVFVVRCHGQSQRISLDEAEMSNVRTIELGRAFVPVLALPPVER
jgi:hypothetical protein